MEPHQMNDLRHGRALYSQVHDCDGVTVCVFDSSPGVSSSSLEVANE